MKINPLTPVPPITPRDGPWPFFHFWRDNFWPKLESSILNFGRRKDLFNDTQIRVIGPNEAWDMGKNAQKVERKTQSKISYHYTWLIHVKNCPSRSRFLRSILTGSKPSRRSITGAKRKEKEKKQKRKKIPKIEKPKGVGHFLDFCACPSHNVVKRDACGKKGKLLSCKPIFDQIKTNLAEIQPKNHENVQTTHFFA